MTVLEKQLPRWKRLLEKQKLQLAVLGGGSWGTALVKVLTDNGYATHWYIRNEVDRVHIEKHRHHPRYLSSTRLKIRKIHLNTNILEVVEKADVLIIAIPSAFVEEVLKQLPKTLLAEKIVFTAVKGVVPGSMVTLGEHLNKNYNLPLNQIGVIAGPSHAEEVALERLSYLTIACVERPIAAQLAKMMKNHYIRTKVSNDIIGTEYAAMLKNVYAVAAGVAHSLNYGDNFQSVLMSNAIREMKRFIKDVYKMKRNINNSAYLGDLLVTGYSTFSRNRSLGTMIGKGYGVKTALMEMNMIAEGYYATQMAVLINKKYRTRIPIIKAMHQILYEGKSARKVMHRLTKKLD